MKQLHILLFIMIPFWNQAQHTIPIDSAAIEQFFQKVDRVELVEIRKTVSMRIISDRKGKITDTIITSDLWCDDLRKTKRALSGVEVPVLF